MKPAELDFEQAASVVLVGNNQALGAAAARDPKRVWHICDDRQMLVDIVASPESSDG